MTRTVSSDAVARDQIRAFVERILRMKEEAKSIKDDIREIYAEAKGNGFDKTVLGQVVSYVEKREKDPDTLAERSALFELYLTALDGAGTENALTHTHEEIDHDPITGEVIETDAVQNEQFVQNDQSAVSSTPPESERGGSDGGGVQSAPAVDPIHEPDGPSGQGGAADAAMAAGPATQSPASDTVATAFTAADPAEEASAPASSADPIQQNVGEQLAQAAIDGPGDGAASIPLPPGAPTNVTAFTPKPLRPYCQPIDGQACGGFLRKHCDRCERLHAQQLDIEAGGKEIQHQGSVG